MNGVDGQADVVTESDVRWSIGVGKARRHAHEAIDQVPGDALYEWYRDNGRRCGLAASSVLGDLYEWSEEREAVLQQIDRLTRGLSTVDLIALLPVFARHSEAPLVAYRPGPPPEDCEVVACSDTGLKFRRANGDRPTGGKAG